MILFGILIGIEGSEGITALAVSPSKKYLAVCEKAERAICTVYASTMDAKSNTLVFKKKKVLISVDYDAKEFIYVSFSH